MKTTRKISILLASLFVCGSVIAAFKVFADPPSPAITITALGTNVFSVAITNDIGAITYDLQWTPALAGPDYQWTWVTTGTPGQTNFLIGMQDYQVGFFRTILDTNNPPLWELADPNNPGLGVLAVTIDSPTNNAVLQ
jgi:hypothetical protein